MEYEVMAEVLHEFRSHNADISYYPIVGGGANACVMHYRDNDQPLRDGELLLLDAGCEHEYYASDITRTFPIGGRFTPAQRAVYEAVLNAQMAAIDKVRAGNHWNQPHEAAVREITHSLVKLGLLKGRPARLIKEGAYLEFFNHRTGHWLGIDVHDVGDYKVGGEWRVLETGMALTVEPGIYIRPSAKTPKEFWNIGVRIEDDVLVTESGHELLSQKLPRDPAEIEKIMAEAAKERAAAEKSPVSQKVQSTDSTGDVTEIRALIAKYVKSIDDADTTLAFEIWSDSPDVSFIHPRGEAHGWDEIKRSVYEDLMGGLFSQRDLQVRDVTICVYEDAAWAEFNWHFVAKWRSDGPPVTTDGKETQVYRRGPDGRWRLVHVHYSGLPVTGARQGV